MRNNNDGPEYGYMRQTADGEWMVIPSDEVDEHDELEREILESEWMSERWCVLTNKYDKLYYQEYRVEGGIYDLKVVIE